MEKSLEGKRVQREGGIQRPFQETWASGRDWVGVVRQ